MKREIKFRVWDNKNQIMIYDALQLKKDCILQRVNLEERTSDDVVWLQFTGLKDSKGKEIYEGDIVENGYSGIWIIQHLEYGSMSLLGVCEKYKGYNYDISALNASVEIMGNIYEKPELLTLNN